MSELKMAGWEGEGPMPEPAATIYHDTTNDAFVFKVAGVEVLRLASDGTMSFYGRVGGKDEEAFEAMRQFLHVVANYCKVNPPQGSVLISEEEYQRLKELDK